MTRIDDQIVIATAEHALVGRFRQIPLQNSSEFERWLSKRGIVASRQVLHLLWVAGLLQPVAIEIDTDQSTAINMKSDRFIELPDWDGIRRFGDRGLRVEDINIDQPLNDEKDHTDEHETLQWHPFQALRVDQVLRGTRFHLSAWNVLNDEESMLQTAIQLRQFVRQRIRADGFQGDELMSRQTLALSIAADPLVHNAVTGRLTYQTIDDYQRNDYFDWVLDQDGDDILRTLKLEPDDAVDMYGRLVFQARSLDPFGPYRSVIRESSFDERSRLSGSALLAQESYDQAKVIRVFLRDFFQRDLDDELTYGVIKPRKELTHQSRRRRHRRLGIDLQEAVRWFLEGDTEKAYVDHWAALNLSIESMRSTGIELRNAKGNSFFETPQYLEELRSCKREQVFAYASSDEDIGDGTSKSGDGVRQGVPTHILALQKLRAGGLLPIGFTVWKPSFVAANFTVDELANISREWARSHGVELSISSQEIDLAMHLKPNGTERYRSLKIEQAIEYLLRQHSELIQLAKGVEWGKLLAKWATEHPLVDPSESRVLWLNNDQRPITQLILKLMRARDPHTDYDLSVEHELSRQRGIDEY